jgi:hypothetical protein
LLTNNAFRKSTDDEIEHPIGKPAFRNAILSYLKQKWCSLQKESTEDFFTECKLGKELEGLIIPVSHLQLGTVAVMVRLMRPALEIHPFL